MSLTYLCFLLLLGYSQSKFLSLAFPVPQKILGHLKLLTSGTRAPALNRGLGNT